MNKEKFKALIDYIHYEVKLGEFEDEPSRDSTNYLNPNNRIQGNPDSPELYFAVFLDQYLTGKKSLFDLHLKLGSEHFVKVLHKKESFDIPFLTRLEARGVKNLHINLLKLNHYLLIQGKILFFISKDQTAPISLKTSIICGQGKQILSMFQELRNQKTLQNLDIFISSIQNLVEEYRLKLKENFPYNVFQDLMIYDHAVSTVVMAILIAKGVKILSQAPLRTIVIASLFHDVSIEDYSTDKDCFEAKDFLDHPVKSEEILSQFNYFDRTVLQAVRQHHMRNRGRMNGFPSNNKKEELNQISQIIGLADEISRAHEMLLGRFNATIDENSLNELFNYLDLNVFPNFNRTLTEPTKEILFKDYKKPTSFR